MTSKKELKQNINKAMMQNIPKNIVVTIIGDRHEINVLRLSNQRYISINFNKNNTLKEGK